MYGALICTAMSVLRGDDTTHVSFEASFVVLYVLRLDYAYISLSISLGGKKVSTSEAFAGSKQGDYL